MKTLFTIFLISLPCFALAGDGVRIVRCTDGLYAVQDVVLDPFYEGPDWREATMWRTLPAGCVPLEAAKRMYAEELAWRNRPPAPSVIEPVEVVEP